jgi:hypothetical protein
LARSVWVGERGPEIVSQPVLTAVRHRRRRPGTRAKPPLCSSARPRAVTVSFVVR